VRYLVPLFPQNQGMSSSIGGSIGDVSKIPRTKQLSSKEQEQRYRLKN
jgi:hypothetical protein